MLLVKEGFPEEDETVLCTVTKVMHHSVFVNCDEYNKGGMIHISEVSPGRIRNIRDYVVPGKKVVCKVLRIDKEKGHIDLSLRRVNERQRKEKIEEIKQEQRAEKIIENIAKEMKISAVDLFKKVSEKILAKYDSIFTCFIDISIGKANLAKLGVEPKIAEKLESVIKEKIKPKEVEIAGEFFLQSYASNGVEVIREILKTAEKLNKNMAITYLGAGKYKLLIKAADYKTAETILEKSKEQILENFEKQKSHAEFLRKTVIK